MRAGKGFTLVEVMVAALLFSVIMLSGISFFSLGNKPSARAAERIFALSLIENDMENAHNNGPEYVRDYGGTLVTKDGVTYTISRVVTYNSPLTGCIGLEETVTWTPPQCQQKSLFIEAVFSNRAFPWP